MAVSSLSFIAAYLRLADAKRTLVTIPRPFLTPEAYWMFWGPDDDHRPPHILFLNASTQEEAARRMQSAEQRRATREWLTSGAVLPW